MAGEKELKDVHVRLERLEEKLETVGRAPAAADLTEADIEAFHRVQNAFWEDGTCGINETSPCVFRCNIWKGGKVVPVPHVPQPCDRECICGPGDIRREVFGRGFSRFGGLGG